MKLKVFTDGGSRGNPGNAGIGVYITDENGREVEKRYKSLGTKTNNEAEYLGAYYGIKRAIELGAKQIELFMDSKLVISQLSGEWKIKKDELKKIYIDIIGEIGQAGVKVIYKWIRREENKEADRLSNVAMDNNKQI
ncbi:MAG: ribonuclease HI family protein [Candidatus Gracilibacteria bacterium]|nr:ribonuclease HI family protein [Candidatus Gracilibacteria bacterium]